MNASQGSGRRNAIKKQPGTRKLRTLLVSLNAKFEHENPAAWYLKAICDRRGTDGCGDVAVLSRTINDSLSRTFGDIAERAPDVVGLSCYIWNRDVTLRLCADLRAVFPKLVLVAGGPEVSYADGGDDYLEAGVDFILAGEGEERFPELLELLSSGSRPDVGKVAEWRFAAAPLHPDRLTSPCCPEYLAALAGRIAYVESSRGCPYRCSYCLSSESFGMTLIPLERVFREVEQLVAAGVKVIKFVDRTFNLSEERTLRVWNHLRRYRDAGVVFHFEVAPDLLSVAQIALLGDLPAGLVQIEAGFQSANPETLARIGRGMDVEAALGHLRQVVAAGNVHVHADLIAGLPGEGLAQFAASFDRLASVHPHHLQLGFLKLLRGTGLWRDAEKWGYARRGYAPYEVLASSALSVMEMLRLKDVEETVERFANSGRFLLVMQWLIPRFHSPFALMEALVEKQRRMGLLGRAVSSDTLFRCMREFLEEGHLSAGTGPAGVGGPGPAVDDGPVPAVDGGPEPAVDGGPEPAVDDGPEPAVDGGPVFAVDDGPVFAVDDGPVFAGNAGAALAVDDRLALLRLDWVCAHRNPFLPEWLADESARMTAEIGWLREAYGMGDDRENGMRHPNAREIHNRYYAVVAVLPPGVRFGIRLVPGNGGTGTAEIANGRTETGEMKNTGRGNKGSASMKCRILIDVKVSDPVLGRPEIVAMSF